MSSPIAIPRSNKASSASSSSGSYSSVASSSSSPATSYHSLSTPSSPTTAAKGLYVPVHRRSPSPSIKALPQTQTAPSPAPAPSRIYSIPFLLSLRPQAHEGMKEKMRAGPAPELVMNRRMRKNLEFAEHQHKRVSPTSSVHVSPVAKSSPLPAVAPVVISAPAPAPQQQTQAQIQSTTKRIPSRSRTRFTGRAPERRRQALGGLQSNLASWRAPVAPRFAVL